MYHQLALVATDTAVVEVVQQTDGVDLDRLIPVTHMDWNEWWKGEVETGDFTVGDLLAQWGDFKEGSVFLCKIDDEAFKLWPDLKAIFDNYKGAWLHYTKPAREGSKVLYAACMGDQHSKDILAAGPPK
jgi:hypothetical protein